MDEERVLTSAKKVLEELEIVEDEIRMNGGRPSTSREPSTNNKVG